jgi:sulfate/thiosulfate transport system substrate-binding protein
VLLKRVSALIAILFVAVGTLAQAGAARPDRSASAKLTLVAYSTPREAYGQIIPLFQKSAAGRDVSFEQSYGSSGEQARAVLSGLDADVVALSLEPDVTDLVDAGLVDKNWNKGFYKGMVTNSVVVFAVRDGNPKKIKNWDDLIKPGVEVITPNPLTSGGARWNVMAAYGAQRKLGKTHKQATDYLLKLFQHVTVQDKSARESLQTFLSGKGDVLLAYENEAIFANRKGQKLPYVIPRSTILIENPVAVVNKTAHPREAHAFVSFLRTPAAQRIFAENGYRPVVKSVAKQYKFPARPGLFTINQLGLGGWESVQKQFFDPRSGVFTRIQREAARG